MSVEAFGSGLNLTSMLGNGGLHIIYLYGLGIILACSFSEPDEHTQFAIEVRLQS